MAFIKFDDLEIYGEISDNYENIENIQKSEAGTDVGTVTRLLKLSLNISTKCNGLQYEALKNKAQMLSGNLEYKGETKRARLRIGSANFEKYSDKIEGINGLWTVSLSIIEV